jgi:hypothetical protein
VLDRPPGAQKPASGFSRPNGLTRLLWTRSMTSSNSAAQTVRAALFAYVVRKRRLSS